MERFFAIGRRRCGRVFLPLLLVALLVPLWSCTGRASGGPQVAEDLRVQRGSVEPVVLITGELAAEDSVQLAIPNVNIWPVTLRWIVDEGEEVAAGDPVVEFDNSQLVANLETLQSGVVTAANSLAQIRAQAASEHAQAFFQLEEKKATWRKAELAAAMPKELTSEQEWARLQLELHKAELERQKAEKAMVASETASQAAIAVERLALEKAEMALGRAQRGLEAMTILAPRGGIVQVAENGREDRPYRAGDASWPGQTVASLPDLSSLYVVAKLFDVDDGRIAAGDEVDAVLDAFAGETLHGEVRSVAGFAQDEGRTSSRRSFRVLVDLEGIDPERMRPGMSVKLEVRPRIEEGLLAPRSALGIDNDAAVLQLADGSRRGVDVGTCDVDRCLVSGVEEGTLLSLVAPEVTK